MSRLRTAFALAGTLAVLATGCRPPAARAPLQSDASRRIGMLRVSATSRPEQPRLGPNVFALRILDDQGRPVSGAEVRAAAAMEAMGTMPRMENRGEVREASPGNYEIAYRLNMIGEWDMAVDIRAPGLAPHHVDYRVSTNVKDIGFVGGTPSAPAGAAAGATPDEPGPSATGADVPVDATMRQSIGLKTAPVTREDLDESLRLPGRVAFDETRQRDIAPRFSGYARDMYAGAVGAEVGAGEVLFLAYSPELLAAQQEYLGAARMANADSSRPEARELLDSAHRKLRLWGLGAAEIERLGRDGRALEAVPVRAPVRGVILEKEILSGGAFSAGQKLFRIAPFDPIWVTATLYEQQLPLVRVGMEARVSFPYAGRPPLRGRVSYISPTLSPDTRTAEARIELANPGGLLKPGMFLDVAVSSTLRGRVSVPVSAVIYSGEQRIVFVDRGDGRLTPREVRLGQKSGERYEVLGGLTPGERVVVSGNFLVAAESRLKSALGRWDSTR